MAQLMRSVSAGSTTRTGCHPVVDLSRPVAIMLGHIRRTHEGRPGTGLVALALSD